MTALSTLINEYLRTNNLTQSDLVKESGLSRARINQLALGQESSIPRPSTLEKLAKGLKLPLSVVQEAALADRGVVGTIGRRSQRINEIAGRLEYLSETDLDYVSLFVSALAGMSHGK